MSETQEPKECPLYVVASFFIAAKLPEIRNETLLGMVKCNREKCQMWREMKDRYNEGYCGLAGKP